MTPIKPISIYLPDFLPQDDADRFFTELSKLEWKRHIITMYGRKIPAPRQYQWMGIGPNLYGESIATIEWTPVALEIRERVKTITDLAFNSLNINYYRDEKDHLGWHVDKQDEGSWDYPIASVSLGAVREFQLMQLPKENHSPLPAIALAHGSLVVMPAGSQKYWLHRLKPATPACGPRINLTFRMME